MAFTRCSLARIVALAAASATLPLGSPLVAGAQTPVTSAGASDPLALVHPELRPALEALLEFMPPDLALTPETLPFMREMQSQFALPRQPEPAVTEEVIPGPADAPELRVFVINAEPDANRPAILYMFGGGFVMGSAADYVAVLQWQALALDCTIVAVEYRLAPETPFPGSLEDNYAALTWLYSHAEELGVDPNRIALRGDSAGGGHAAMLSIAARDRGEVPIIFQALIYPMLDDRTGSRRQMPDHIGTFIWPAEFNRFGWSSLLGEPAGSDDVPAGAVPARLDDLSGLPPTWIGVGAIDLFVKTSSLPIG